MDRVMCIEIVKNIQSMALNVQRYLEQAGNETYYCKRCSKADKHKKKFGLNKARNLRPHSRPKDLSSFLWVKHSNYSRLKNDSSTCDEILQTEQRDGANSFLSSQRQQSDSTANVAPVSSAPQSVRRNAEASLFFERESSSKRQRLEHHPSGADEDSPTRSSEETESSKVKSEPQDLTMATEDSAQLSPRPSTLASEVLKSLASKTKSTSAPQTASAVTVTDGFASSGGFVDASRDARAEESLQPEHSSTNAALDSAAAAAAAALSKNVSFASDILKSLASKNKSQTLGDATVKPESGQTINDAADEPDFNEAPAKPRPSSDILRNILESLPVDTLDQSEEIQRLMLSDNRRGAGGGGGGGGGGTEIDPKSNFCVPVSIPAIFGGGSVAKTMFSFSATNPFTTSADYDAFASSAPPASFAWSHSFPTPASTAQASILHTASATSFLSQLAQCDRSIKDSEAEAMGTETHSESRPRSNDASDFDDELENESPMKDVKTEER